MTPPSDSVSTSTASSPAMSAIVRRADDGPARARIAQRRRIVTVGTDAAELTRIRAGAGLVTAGEDHGQSQSPSRRRVTARDPATAEDDQRHRTVFYLL